MDLKPCPFCRGDGSLDIDGKEKIVFGSCWDCGARGQAVQYKERLTYEDIAKAIEAWNGRTDNES